ncbi:MAG: TldD/PmbA family protein [Solirubrobacterales bacterium]
MTADATAELETVTGRAVDAALSAGAQDAEAAAQDSVGREIRIFDGEVESLTEAGERGLGVRAWIEGRVGFAYGTDLSDEGVERIAGDAVEAARVSDADEFAAAPEPVGHSAEAGDFYDAQVAATPTEVKVGIAKAIERSAREADGRVVAVETTVYVDEEERSALRSSRGVGGSHEATFAYAYLQAIAEENGSKQTGLGFGLGRSPIALDPQAIGREAAERSVQLLGASKPRSRICPVVLDPTVAASFTGFIGGVLCADAVQRGRSPFAGRLGERIASDAFALTDDGLDPEGMASAPVDAEGLARTSTALIDEGRLETYLHDSYTARREGGGQASTASASRAGYRSAPSVSTSNLIIAPGTAGLDELFAQAGDGVYITDVAGLHSGVNPVSGQFSVGASGVLIEGGELTAAATEFTIASDLVAMLSAVRAAGSEARWVPFGGSVKAPPLLIAEMTVGGT